MDGAALAARLREELKEEVGGFGPVGLATVLVGDDPGSAIYIRNKHRAAGEVGIEAIDKRLPTSTPEDELVELVRELNEDDGVDGILVQTPLPRRDRPGLGGPARRVPIRRSGVLGHERRGPPARSRSGQAAG